MLNLSAAPAEMPDWDSNLPPSWCRPLSEPIELAAFIMAGDHDDVYADKTDDAQLALIVAKNWIITLAKWFQALPTTDKRAFVANIGSVNDPEYWQWIVLAILDVPEVTSAVELRGLSHDKTMTFIRRIIYKAVRILETTK